MIRQSHRHAEPLLHIRDCCHIHILILRRILAAAFQQHHLLVSLSPARLKCLPDLFLRRHSAGHNHRLSLARRILDQWNIHQLKGRDFVELHIQILQEIDRCPVKRRRQKIHTDLPALIPQRLLPFPRGIGRLVELIIIIAVPQTALDLIRFLPAVDRERIRRVGLYLHTIRAGFCRLLNDFECILNFSRMVCGHLCNHIDPAVHFLI